MIERMTLAALGMMMSAAAMAQSSSKDKALTNFEDTTMMLQEVTVKSTLPKTRVTIFGPRELTQYNPDRRFISLDVTWKFNETRSKYRGTGAGKEQKARL